MGPSSSKMAAAGHVVSATRVRLASVFSFHEPMCSSKLVKSRKSYIIGGLALVIFVSVIHLATHITSNSTGSLIKTPVPLHSKLKVKNFKGSNTAAAVASVLDEEIESSIAQQFHQLRLKILVASYMRSGSTLCGNILQAHPDVFYVYEPLLYLWDHYLPGKKPNQYMTIRQRAKALWRESKPVIPRPLDFLSYIFRCNMTTYNLDFLTNVAHSRAFTESGCVKISHGSNVMNVTEQCAMGVLERCQASSAVAQKAVRLSMAEASRLLHKDPTIRLVHLVRDPRGVLLSRMRFNHKTTGEMHNNYTNICRRMLEDVKASKRMNEEQWGRVLTVRYEDLAQDLLSITSIIYDFVGLEMLPTVQDYLSQMTSANEVKKNGKFTGKSTFRKDPYKTAYKWREDLPFSLVQRVDATCQEVYNALGYVAFQQEDELRDEQIPAKMHNYGEGLMTASIW